MFSVKRLPPETILFFNEATRVGLKTPKHITYAVVYEDEIVKDSNGNYEFYPQKQTAERVAANYNQHNSMFDPLFDGWTEEDQKICDAALDRICEWCGCPVWDSRHSYNCPMR